jgi:hypothetical protein
VGLPDSGESDRVSVLLSAGRLERMTVEELIASARKQGVSLDVYRGKVIAFYVGSVPLGLARELKRRKAEILAHLKRNAGRQHKRRRGSVTYYGSNAAANAKYINRRRA